MSEIPLDMLVDLMKCADNEDTLELTVEGKEIRVKGMFIINQKGGEAKCQV